MGWGLATLSLYKKSNFLKFVMIKCLIFSVPNEFFFKIRRDNIESVKDLTKGPIFC